MPNLPTGIPSFAFSEPIRISQARANSSPALIAGPLITAIVIQKDVLCSEWGYLETIKIVFIHFLYNLPNVMVFFADAMIR